MGCQTVLIIEDSRTLNMALGRWASLANCVSLMAESVEAAATTFTGQNIDIIVLDMMLPGVCGADAVRLVQQIWPGVPVVAMSGEDERDDNHEIKSMLYQARTAGVDYLMKKPFSQEEFAFALSSARRMRVCDTPKHVLAVDDSKTILAFIRKALEPKGYRVTTKLSMEEAFDAIDVLKVDCVLTDIFMPGMGGIEGILNIRKMWPGVKVCAMSSGMAEKMGAGDALLAAAKIGADAAIEKPFTPDQAAEIIDGIFSGKYVRAA
jgi:CheY-like chemotaxis protein